MRIPRLAPVEALFVARAGATAALAHALLRGAPLPWVARIVSRRGPLPLPLPEVARRVALTDRLLALDRGPLRPNCVLRSLVLLRYLPAGTQIRFGIRPGVRPLDGHAWVERAGEPVAERQDPRGVYIVTWSWGGP